MLRDGRNGRVAADVSKHPARVVAPKRVRRLKRQLDGARARPFAHHDVELKIFERRVQRLLDDGGLKRWISSMNSTSLVSSAGEMRREIAGALEHGARGLVEIHAELVGDDVRERGLAEAPEAKQQRVVERLAALARGRDEDLHLRLHARLADVLVRGAAGARRGRNAFRPLGRRSA